MIKSGFSPWGEMKTSSPFFKSIWKVLFGNDCIVKFLFPFIMAVLGVVLNIAISKSFDMNIFLGGLLSGLSSVGLHQSFKALIENK